MSDREKALRASAPPEGRFNFEWLVASVVLLPVGWATCFPVTGGLGRQFGRSASAWWGYLYLAAGFLCALGTWLGILRPAEFAGTAARRSTWVIPMQWLAGLGVMLVLGWFIKSQLFGDFRYGLRGAFRFASSGSGWSWRLGNLYFALILAYGALGVRHYLAARNSPPGKTTAPRAGWLFALLSLALVMTMFVSNEARNWTMNGEPRGWSVFSFGVLIAAAFGAWYYLRSLTAVPEPVAAAAVAEPAPNDATLERLGACLGLVFGMGLDQERSQGLGQHLS